MPGHDAGGPSRDPPSSLVYVAWRHVHGLLEPLSYHDLLLLVVTVVMVVMAVMVRVVKEAGSHCPQAAMRAVHVRGAEVQRRWADLRGP